MGKRELLLVLGFVVAGVIVYQVTAPAPPPGERGFSLGGIIDRMRREVRGDSASAEATSSVSLPVPAAVTELRVNITRGPITIVGDDRATIDSDLHVRSTGYDAAEAEALARQTVLKVEQTGSLMVARVQFPEPGRQTPTLTLKVPSRLRVRIEGTASRLDVRGVAAIEVDQVLGETAIRDVAGGVSAAHRGGKLTVEDVGALDLTIRGSTVELHRVAGTVEVAGQAGELRATGLVGRVTIDTNGTRVEVGGFDKAQGPLRIESANGGVTVDGLWTEGRIDVRNASLDVRLARPVPLSVASEGSQPITISVPGGGFRVDALARDARIHAEPADLFNAWRLSVEESDGSPERRLSGDVAGGGPLITVRSHRGEIKFLPKAGG